MNEPEAGTVGQNESDSNEDTCCLGSNFIILKCTQRTADVYPYDSSYKQMTNVPIVTGATAWTDPLDNKVYILVFNESLYYGTKLGHSLIYPNQIRHNGIDFWDNPFDKAKNVAIDIDRGTMIPLKFIGTKLIFSSRAPTPQELAECQHIDMTSTHQWDPASVLLASVSSNIHHEPPPFCIHISSTGTTTNPHCYSSQDKFQYQSHDSDSAILHDMSPSLIELRELAVNAKTPRSGLPTR